MKMSKTERKKSRHAHRAKKMRNINEVILSGNIVNVPTTREHEGIKYADLTVASTRRAFQNDDGSWESHADYIPVSLSGKLAERVADLPKGSDITLRGYVESFTYKKDDKTVHGLRVHAVEIISAIPKKAKDTDVVIASDDLPF